MVECSDVVVSALGLGDPPVPGVLAALEHHHPAMPVVVAVPRPALGR
jgi:hypothetical protein